MSTFTLNSITVQGLNIIAKLVAGSQLEFTRIAVGDGAMPSDKTPLTVTDLTHKLFDVDINSVVNNDNGSATVKGVFSNTASETGFFYRELGLFAKDPDTKKEILYCYGNAAADAEWISPAGSSSVIEKEVSIITLIGNAEKITVSLKSGIYTTKEDLDNLLDFRHQSTDYKVGDKVLCEYNCMLFLECTKAGTTDNNILNTRGFIHGQVVHDGTVEWIVRTNIKSINNLKADSNGNVAINDFLEKTGGTVTGDINASGYNITATKFIGKLQGKADSATNAETANKLGTSTVGSATKPVYINNGVASAVSVDLSTLAPKESPGLTGTPTAPTANADTNNTQIATCEFVRNAIAKFAPMLDTMKKIYPVGSIYISTVSTNPATLFGFGTWEAMPAGRVLLAQGKSDWGTTYEAGSSGGEATHQLTVGELPSHGHTASTDTININGGFRLDGTEIGSTTSASGVFSIGSSFTPSKGHGSSGGGSNVGRNINFNSTHSHKITINNVGEGQSHNNIQPYLTVYMWKRVS